MISNPNALLRRGDGLYEPLRVLELCERRIAPERIVLAIEVVGDPVPIGSPLPRDFVIARRTARLVSWFGDAEWCRPVYVEDHS